MDRRAVLRVSPQVEHLDVTAARAPENVDVPVTLVHLRQLTEEELGGLGTLAGHKRKGAEVLNGVLTP